MKFLLPILLSMTFVSNSFASVTFQKMDDDSVSASLVMDQKIVSSPDRKVSAKLLTVFRGSLDGVSSVIVSISDQGPSPGDMPNTTSYEIRPLLGAPKSAVMTKIDKDSYQLKIEGQEVISDVNGDLQYPDITIDLSIELGKDGSVKSVIRK